MVILEQQHLNPRSVKWKIKETSDDVDKDKLQFILNNITSQIEAYNKPKGIPPQENISETKNLGKFKLLNQ